MIAALRSPARRVTLAIVLSALMHAAILWLPHFHLPHEKLSLPTLTVRIEYPTKTLAQPSTIPAPITQTGKPDIGTLGKPDVGKPTKPETGLPVKPGDSKPDKSLTNTADTMKQMEKSAAPPQFPKHLQITFTGFRGANNSSTAELHQQLDIDGGSYTLTSNMQLTGLASLQSIDQVTRTSRGKVNEHGLQPETFNEERMTGRGKQNLEATFDRKGQKLLFSTGGDSALPDDAQDMLSFSYQLSQISLQKEMIPLSITNGMKLDQIQFEAGGAEDISTPMGNLHTLRLRKSHAQGEAYFEVWLGMEYRLLPVKLRQTNALGKVIEEFSISDIRASDE